MLNILGFSMELSTVYTSTTPGINGVICKYKIKTMMNSSLTILAH